ncbi:hypothetical protein HDU96_004648 [Phlyctochytrium bullatum]|nr:hypothetical protein HDU96_004648 [Phlyctochytrium bullatum]
MSLHRSHKSSAKARKSGGLPFNLLVAGHSHTGKSSFIQTLIESLEGRRIMSDSAAAAASSSANSSAASSVESLPTPTSPSSVVGPLPNGTLGAKTPVLLSAIFPGSDITAPTPVKARIDFEEESSGERISLRLIDSPGLPIPVNIHKGAPNNPEYEAIGTKWASMIIQYIEAQYEATLMEESKVRRNPKSPDFQIHACVYMLDPQVCLASRGLTPIDRVALQRLCTRANVIPCISKADLLTSRQLRSVRQYVMDDLRRNQIPVLAFAEDPEMDDDMIKLNAQMKALMPFAVINDEELDPSTSNLNPAPATSAILAASTATLKHESGPLGRTYAWGTVEVENPSHCDFVSLRTVLFGTHFEELKISTREVYYEQWRTEKLLEVRGSVLLARSKSGTPAGSVKGASGVLRKEE